MAFSPTSAIQQKVYRLCFIPNSRRLFMPYSLCCLDALVACVTIMVWYCRFMKYVAELYIACDEHNSYAIKCNVAVCVVLIIGSGTPYII